MNFIFGVAFFLGAAAFILFAIVTVFKKIRGKDIKGPLKTTMISFVIAVIGVIGIGVTQEDVPEADDNSNTQSESTSESVAEESDLTNDQQAALDNLNSFPTFIESYKNLNKEERTPLWDEYIAGTEVTWTGEVFEIAGDSLYVYGSDDYNGESWMDLSGEGNKAYKVFIADFDDPTVYEDVSLGDTVTITGSLDSRGDYDLNYNWKLYNSELK